jgi:hypothetical protein
MPQAAPRRSELLGWHDWRVDDCRGQRLGTMAAVYVDAASAAPAWFLVRLGRYSTRFVLAPAADVLAWDGRISLPWERLRIERAPLLYSPPPAIGPELEHELRRHYGLLAASDVNMTARRSVA